MTVRGINLMFAPFTVGVRIYHTATGALVASNSMSIPGGGLDLTVTIPVTTTLACGEGYRIGAFVDRGSGNFFFATSSPLTDPFDENLDVFRILGARSSVGDVFPMNHNILHPQTTVHGEPAMPGTNNNTGISIAGDIVPQISSCTTPRIGKPYLLVSQALVLDVTSPAVLPLSHTDLLVSEFGG